MVMILGVYFSSAPTQSFHSKSEGFDDVTGRNKTVSSKHFDRTPTMSYNVTQRKAQIALNLEENSKKTCCDTVA